MTALGPLIKRRGASWIHRQQADQAPTEFAHTLCGLSFSRDQVREISDTGETTCTECIAIEATTARSMILAGLPTTEFHPRHSAEEVAAWAGPQVEILVNVDQVGTPEIAGVFLDGIEVPVTHMRTEVVDPRAGYLRTEWDRETVRLSREDDLSPAFRSAIASERRSALMADDGTYIVGAAVAAVDAPAAAGEAS